MRYPGERLRLTTGLRPFRFLCIIVSRSTLPNCRLSEPYYSSLFIGISVLIHAHAFYSILIYLKTLIPVNVVPADVDVVRHDVSRE